MQNTQKLLSIKNLKKYFPIAKSSIFQKEQLYVRANEEITIDIHSGETFGLVGESGCGKSTLGRTILQLYPQTAGSTLYYGRTLEDFAPSYVAKTLKNAPKMIARYKKMQQKAEKLTVEVEAAGENATFFQHQNKNLAIAEADTAFQNVVKILGGFAALEDCTEGAKALLVKFNTNVKLSKLNEQVRDYEGEVAFYKAVAEELRADETVKNPEAKIRAAEKKAAAFAAKAEALKPAIEKLHEVLIVDNQKIADLKAKYASDAKFQEYEAMLDNGIDLSRLKYTEMRILRKDIQIIFQDPYSSLNPRMTVGQIIGEGLTTHKFFKAGSPLMKDYILKVSIQSQIINLLEELKEKENLTYLFISHDLSVVRYISDRIGVMYLGNMVELGTAEEIFADPRHPYTVALLSSIPTTDVNALKKERIILEGNIPSPIKPPDGCKFHTRCYMACDKCKRVPPPTVEVKPGHFVACHFLDQKIDENGNYLFETPGKKA